MILMVFMLAGIIQIGMGVGGLGKYIKYIPYPVVSGFMTAIGVIILITQILPFLGYYPKDDKAFVDEFKPYAEEVLLEKIIKQEADEKILVLEDFAETINRAGHFHESDILKEAEILATNASTGVIGSIRTVPRALGHINWTDVILASATIVIIYGFKRITKAVPSTLVALVTVTGLAYFLKIDYRSIDEIPGGFPKIHFEMFTAFNLAGIAPYLGSAITLALLGSIDSLLTSVVADNITKTRHDPNRELVGQGIGNSIASIFGGIPGAGATIRTVINISSGGKTRLSGMIAGTFLLFILLALGPVASKIPAAVLAGILVTVGIGVMDYKGLRAIKNVPATEVFIMVLVLILSVFWNLVYAVGVGLVLASLVFMKKMADFTARQSKVVPIQDESQWSDELLFPKNLKEEVYIGHINGPLFFGSTSEIQKLSTGIPETASHIVIRMDRVPYIDQSGLYALEDLIMELRGNGLEVLIVGLQLQPRNLMEKIDIIPALIGENHLFEHFSDATGYILKTVEDTSTSA